MTTEPDTTHAETSTDVPNAHTPVPFTSGVSVPTTDFAPDDNGAEFQSSRSPFSQPPDGIARSLQLIAERLERIEQNNAREFGLIHTKLNWLGEATQWLTGMLSGVQTVAAQMGGPMGSVVRKMMGGSNNG